MQQLQIVDDELASYLKISPDERKRFTYYIFEDRLEEHWNVFGLHYLSRAPLLVEIRLMYIDQDARDWSPFVAERDAPGYAVFNRGTYPSVIAFFEETALNKEILDHNESIRHFFLMNRKELLQFHYPQERVEAAVGNYYRYVPEKGVQGSEKISVICLPNWSSPHGENQISSLWFITLSPQQLANPQFDLVDDIDGLGTITFNQRALEELIILLRQRI